MPIKYFIKERADIFPEKLLVLFNNFPIQHNVDQYVYITESEEWSRMAYISSHYVHIYFCVQVQLYFSEIQVEKKLHFVQVYNVNNHLQPRDSAVS